MSILIIVHKRVPLKEFKVLLVQFYNEKATRDLVGNESLEIRVVNREETDQNLLDDWNTALNEDADDADVRFDGK